MSKLQLRKKLLKIRKLKYNISNIKFETIKLFLKNKKFKKKPIIGGYFPVSYEIGCLNILHKLEINNFQISLPVIGTKNSMQFYNYSFKDPLKIGKHGIPEPLEKKIVYPDLLFVPLVGFDKRLFRLGYGGGYYDRYLQKLSKMKSFISIGLAFPFQKVNKIPNETFDKKLDLIITTNKIYV